MKRHQYVVVPFFARQHGLYGLEKLMQARDFYVPAVFTHRFERDGRERWEFPAYEELAADYDMPLLTIDKKRDQASLPGLLRQVEPDFLASISWKYIFPPEVLEVTDYYTVNLHRGLLPGYEGAEPVKRMLLDGHEEAVITAHMMVEEVDAGPILATARYPMKYNGACIDDSVEQVLSDIGPLFGPLLLNSLAVLVGLRKQFGEQ